MGARVPLSVVDAALRLLARRSYTRLEMATRLTAKGYLPAEVEAVQVRLEDWGYLDDRAAAERAVADCMERRPRGRNLLAAELEKRGIPAAIVMEALANYPLSREEALASAALDRLGLSLPLRPQDRARAWRALSRLGFAEPTLERLCGFPDP